jgi:hypothetical protein
MFKRLVCSGSIFALLCLTSSPLADLAAHSKFDNTPIESKSEEWKPAEISPVPEQLLKRNTYYIGPELYSFRYKEPGYMREEGTFYGIAVGYTYRGWIPNLPEQTLSDSKTMIRAEGRFAFGQVDYEGQTWGGTPVTQDNIDDFAMEGRLLLGPEWLGEDILNTLYAGIGYRYLNDDSSSDPGGYERESNYYYIPIGYEVNTNIRAGWSLAGKVEFDYFIWGLQRTHLSDVGLLDVDNHQDGGHGYRASLKLQKRSKDAVFVIEPFIRYWDIDDSDVEYAGYDIYVLEPANETTEYGVQLIWMF